MITPLLTEGSLETTTKVPLTCCYLELCLSESCVMAAGTILSSLDKSVDPCEDFYQFSCGGWEQRSSSNSDRFQVRLLVISNTGEGLGGSSSNSDRFQVRLLVIRNTEAGEGEQRSSSNTR